MSADNGIPNTETDEQNQKSQDAQELPPFAKGVPPKRRGLPKNNTLRPNSTALRLNATKQEKRLWFSYLRSFEPRFTRQFIIGNYIADFYCSKVKLVIEVDGLHHKKPEIYDQDRIRTEYFKTLGIKVIRFDNNAIDKDFSAVRKKISEAVSERLQH